MTIEDRYLGDGVYASYDGYHIVLDLRAQDNYTRIALEPQVMLALREYERYVRTAPETCGERLPCGVRPGGHVDLAHVCRLQAGHEDVDSPCVCAVCEPEED